MQKWEYLFVEVVSEQGGTFHYRRNGKDEETDTVNWTSENSLTTWSRGLGNDFGLC